MTARHGNVAPPSVTRRVAILHVLGDAGGPRRRHIANTANHREYFPYINAINEVFAAPVELSDSTYSRVMHSLFVVLEEGGGGGGSIASCSAIL